MIENLYLIDCENVGLGRVLLDDTSCVIYFTSNTKKILGVLNKNEIEIHTEHDKTKDALDFVIDTNLGFYISKLGKAVNYYIISNDKGFDIIVNYWKSHGYNVIRTTEIEHERLDGIELLLKSLLTQKQIVSLSKCYTKWFNSKNRYKLSLENILKSNMNTFSEKSIRIIASHIYRKSTKDEYITWLYLCNDT